MRRLLALLLAASVAAAADEALAPIDNLPPAEKAEILGVGTAYLEAIAAGRIDDAVALVEPQLRDVVRASLTGTRYELPEERSYDVDLTDDGLATVTILNTSYGAELAKTDGRWLVTSRALAEKLKPKQPAKATPP